MRSSLKTYWLLTTVLLSVLFAISIATAQSIPASSQKKNDSLKLSYPFQDKPFLFAPKSYSPIILSTPKNIQREIVYDPINRQYIIRERVGTKLYRPPLYLGFEEYRNFEFKRLEKEYWEELALGKLNEQRRKRLFPPMQIESPVFTTLFGGNNIDIVPRGSAEVTLMGQHNRNQNPMFNERQRNQWGFDFDQNINLHLTGNIGERVKVNANFNSRAQFDFENQIRFDYIGKDDDILRRLEIGNVNMPLNTTLIQGSESLFGVKANLQFGKLSMTGLVAQQRARTKEFTISNGSRENEVKITLDNYEDNQHFFLNQYFRETYNSALAMAPIINTQINILQIEVWMSNRANTTTDSRDVLALMDLGEHKPYSSLVTAGTSRLPSTGIPGELNPEKSNNLLDLLGEAGRAANGNFTQSFFASTGANDHYVKLTYARKLVEGKDYIVNKRLGYISLSLPLNQDQALSVAYKYVRNGREYQVGELSTDIPVNPTEPTALYTKMLKNEVIKTNLPTWDLMMKNIYSLNASNISDNNFSIQIYRTENESGAERPALYEGASTQEKTWLQLAKLDRLTQQQGAGADGLFDYIPDITIQPTRGKLIFPVIEPFGKDLADQFQPGEQALIEKYTFPELYTHTKVDAQQLYLHKNRYLMRGRYNSSSGTEFQLGVFNLSATGIKVMAGGVVLQPGEDYLVDFQIGTLRILNEALVLSGQPITVSVQDDAMFGIQQRTLLGGRFDYLVNNNLKVGATFMKLTEKPLNQKVSIGDEPLSNAMLGADLGYSNTSRWLTRMVDKIPFLSTKEESQISFYGEYAQLIPSHPKGLNTDLSTTGTAYLDDFENAVSYIDIKGQANWQISGTPRHFPESDLINDLRYGYNRALISFYNIDPIFYMSSSLNPNLPAAEMSSHLVREITEQEIFPYKDSKSGMDNYLQTLDIAYYPTLRGPYNYVTTGINFDGTLSQPKSRWGGMYRKLDQTDFEAQNIEFLEMWMMDPALTNPAKEGGDVYVNLGNISEDILKDGRKSLENGISPSGDLSQSEMTNWGYVVKNQPVVQAFDNNPSSRAIQDVGLDGMGDAQEAVVHQNFLAQINATLNAEAANQLQKDPSTDNYDYYLGKIHTPSTGILERYKKYSGLEGNSRTNEQSQADFGVETSARTLLPDAEDINRDNSMNEVDEYFQYKISTRPQDMVVGRNFIVEEQVSRVILKNGNQVDAKWYKIRIPISAYESKYGNINDFKSIRFVRLFMTNFADTTVLRFGRLQFVRGEWRKYNAENDATKVIRDNSLGVVPSDNSIFNVANVNIEENGNRSPIPYVVPPGILRQIDRMSNNLDVELNEQALSMDVKDLRDGYGRATFKTGTHDFRAYGRLELFIHAEGENLRDGDVRGFIRLGTDDRYNYYEYDQPLSITPYGSTAPNVIWPEQNRINITLNRLKEAKIARDKALLNGLPWPLDMPFEYADGPNRITVVGAPDLSKVRYYMMGVKNPLRGSNFSTPLDDGRDLSGEFWFNELRLTDFDDRGGWAATARLDIKLADFANISLKGTKSTTGFGTLNQRLSERKRSEDLFFDITSNAELGKFFHPRHGVVIPFYFNYSKQISTPEYNPYNPDIELNTALATLSNNQKDSLLRLVQDYTTRRSFSFNNVRKVKTNNLTPLKPWNLENFSASYAYSEYAHRDFTTTQAVQKTYRGIVDYTYTNGNIKFYEPFKKVKNDNLKIISDINFNLVPSLINFRINVNRIYHENTLRDNSTNNNLPTYYNKNFNMNRIYGISWDLTKALRLDFNATNYSIIDEPAGVMDGIKRDTLWSNFWKMGRTTDYNHMMNITYTFPIYKVPYLEWINVIARYGAQFNWQSEPLLTLENPDIALGNTIQNNRTIQLNPSFSMQALYNKFGFIRRNSGRNAKGSTAFFTQLLTMVRSVNVAFTRIEGTYLPGYLPVSNALGYDFSQNAPGWGFLLGSQADITSKALQNNWLTTHSLQTQLFSKTYAENISYITNLEPIKGLRIDLTGTRIDNYNLSSSITLNSTTGDLEQFAPYTTGNYSITQIGIKASFKKNQDLFARFEENKKIISTILGSQNLHSKGVNADEFADGYGKDQQDVVVNAFLTTYLGKNLRVGIPSKAPRLPLPNWRMTYNRLAQLTGLDEIFTSININHSYTSQYNIGGYNSLLRYQEAAGAPSERDLENNFLPKNAYQQISILDHFVPLIGIDARFQNQVSTSGEYRTLKTLNYSLQNSQLAMLSEQSFVLGIGYRKNNYRLPFGWLADRKLNNDLNFRMDIAINDRKTSVFRSDISYSEISSGNKSLSYNPTLDLTINQTYNIRLFYNSNVVKPYTSQNYATSYTYFGVNLRVMFQ